MKTALTDDQFTQELSGYERSAFRLELQPAYTVGNERDLFDTFLAGRPELPTTREEFRAYYRQINKKTAAGIRVERVRLVDSPPTDYQRWTRYMDRWNIQAGEIIHYLDRGKAQRVGLTDAFTGRDWWLLDDSRLIRMTFDDKGRRTDTDLTTDDNELQQARSWRDLAIRTARGED
jgi:hypothetical protein